MRYKPGIQKYVLNEWLNKWNSTSAWWSCHGYDQIDKIYFIRNGRYISNDLSNI